MGWLNMGALPVEKAVGRDKQVEQLRQEQSLMKDLNKSMKDATGIISNHRLAIERLRKDLFTEDEMSTKQVSNVLYNVDWNGRTFTAKMSQIFPAEIDSEFQFRPDPWYQMRKELLRKAEHLCIEDG